MNNYINISIVLVFAGWSSLCNAQPSTDKETIIKQSCHEFIGILSKHEFSGLGNFLTTETSDLFNAEVIQNSWLMLLGEAGQFHQLIDMQIDRRQTYYIVHATCEFEQKKIVVKLVLDYSAKICGLWFLPSHKEIIVSKEYTIPAYVNPNMFTEQQISIEHEQIPLPGAVTTPTGSGPFPAVVLVHDMGPHDKDQTNEAQKPFRDIAWGLASRGIATLRYDNREKVHGIHSLPKKNLTVQEIVIDDVITGIASLAENPVIDQSKIFVLGHGLGGMLAPRILSQKPDISGMIILAGMCRGPENIIYQREYYQLSLDGTIDKEDQQQLNKIHNQCVLIRDPDLESKTEVSELLGWPIEIWLDIRRYHPSIAAQKIPQPMLLLQGGRDNYVTLDDFRIWKKYLKDQDNVTFKLYLKLDHLFMQDQGAEPVSNGEYLLPKHVASEVIDDIAQWIKTRP